MNYFIDSEFNGFGGDLISLALVPDDINLAPFYEAVICEEPTSWVKLNVIPALRTTPITYERMQIMLVEYLEGDESIMVTADWPQDLSNFLHVISTSSGQRLIESSVNLRLLPNINFSSNQYSKVPHNAYYDAVALRDYVLSRSLS